jgi:hypothetical protein
MAWTSQRSSQRFSLGSPDTELKTYGAPVCTCQQLPHQKDCPVAPFFGDDEKLSLDSEQGDYHEEPPFIIQCPKGCRFLQFEHAVGYDYQPVEAFNMEQTQIPMVCPKCGFSDKQMLPAIVGFDPSEGQHEDDVFKIQCPNTMCQSIWTREDGCVDIWMEREVLMGVEEARIRGIWFKKGEVTTEYTELSIGCNDCGHQCGETED